MQRTNNVDPFSIPDGTPDTDPRVTAMKNAKFRAGVKLVMGLPAFNDVSKLPDIVDLKPGGANVSYRMLCADIKLAELTYQDIDDVTWKRKQQSDKADEAWVITSNVDLKLDSVAFSNLPADMQNKIKNLQGEMFSIQQLLFDLNNAGLQSVPDFEGVDKTSDVYSLLLKYYVQFYFGTMQKKGQPVLNYTVIHKPQNATLKPTDLNFHISPLVVEKDPKLKTLDYVCATDSHPLPSMRDFEWDWISAADAKQVHGVIAINRKTFANYLLGQILPSARSDCFNPYARCWVDGLSVYFDCHGNSSPTPNPTVTIPDSGDTLIKIYWHPEDAKDYAGLDGALGHTIIGQEYSCTVTANNNKLTITTFMNIWLDIKVLQTKNAANIVRKTFVDDYELSVDEHGQMVSKRTAQPVKDESASDTASWFTDLFTGVNDIFDKLKNQQVTRSNFQAHPIEALQNFVFPGGSTFAFTKFHFSNSRDLLASITYADPTRMN